LEQELKEERKKFKELKAGIKAMKTEYHSQMKAAQAEFKEKAVKEIEEFRGRKCFQVLKEEISAPLKDLISEKFRELSLMATSINQDTMEIGYRMRDHVTHYKSLFEKMRDAFLSVTSDYDELQRLVLKEGIFQREEYALNLGHIQLMKCSKSIQSLLIEMKDKLLIVQAPEGSAPVIERYRFFQTKIEEYEALILKLGEQLKGRGNKISKLEKKIEEQNQKISDMIQSDEVEELKAENKKLHEKFQKQVELFNAALADGMMFPQETFK